MKMDILSIIFVIETVLCFLLGTLGVALLLKPGDNKPSDVMLAHLTLCDMLNIAVNLVVEIMYTNKMLSNQATLIMEGIGYAFLLPHLMTLVIITVDRILAINLVFRYRLVVTNKRLTILLVIVWILSAVYGTSYYFVRSKYYKKVLFSLSLVVVVFFIVSYTYIIIKVRRTRKALSSAGQTNRQSRFNYWIPFTIILTYILFVVVTDLTLVFNVRMSIWHFLVWDLIRLLIL